MTTKHNLQVSNADFDQIKSALKEYMKTNSGLTDVDFEGSGANVLLDILAYNTFYNNMYLNAASNEMFLDTAVQRTNVVAHAAPLGYIPRSFTSARVVGEIVVTPNNTPTTNFLTLSDQTLFLTKIENRNYKFQNFGNVLLEYDGSVFRGKVTLYEGNKYQFNYNVNLQDKDQRFVIPSSDIDLDLIKVGVIRDSKYTEYVKSDSIVNVVATSKCYWVREDDNGKYEVTFGDGIFGEPVSQGDVVVLEYLICNGAIPNGAEDFECQVSIGGYPNVVFNPEGSASGGSVSEDIESVRTNATRYFETQNRAVTWADYESLLMKEFGFLESVSVWGGEDNDPPFYGRVFLTAKPNVGETLTSSEVDLVSRYVESKNIASVKPIFVDPSYIFLKIDTTVKFQYERSPYTIQEVPQRVKNVIENYVDVRLEKFGIPFKYSNLLSEIDQSVLGISSNETTIKLVKRINPSLNERVRYVIQFKTQLKKQSIVSNGFRSDLYGETIFLQSSTTLDSDGEYPITFYYIKNNTKFNVDQKIGYVDYVNGIVGIDFLTISSIENDYSLNVEVEPSTPDYTPTRNTILSSRSEDISVSVVPEISR